jgi:hypothetical protein
MLALAAQADIGHMDGPSGGGEPTGSKRTESALWFNSEGWRANMWDPAAGDFHIFRLDAATQTWRDTGVPVDQRAATSADTLWDGTHLYIASHVQTPTASPGKPSYLFRFSYNAATGTYSPDPGFPVRVNDTTSETLTIDKDSTGTLWATWMQDDRIYVNHTVGADTSWATPASLSVANSQVTSDDISAVVAFGGNRIGIMWGNQTPAADGYYFSVHRDGDPATAWSAPEPALRGSGSSDDHINLKSDSAGTVYAAIKTSHTQPAQPLTMLLARTPDGRWSSHPVDTVSDCPNRPIVVLDESARVAHVLETGPTPPASTCTSGGDIYEKTASLDLLSFGSGLGTPVIRPAGDHLVHNVSSTKQLVTAGSGLVALAPDLLADVYWHMFEPLGAPAARTTFACIADARVSRSQPTTTFGAESTLRVKTWPWNVMRSYIRFDVRGLAAPVRSAKLRLFVKDPGSDGGSIVRVGDHSWSESSITWATAPTPDATALAGPTTATDETWLEYDLGGAVAGNGTYDFAITGGNDDAVYYSSREGAHAPELVVATGG